jgi:transposase
MTSLPPDCVHESLEVGATPLVHHFLRRLNLRTLFDQHLPRLPGKRPALPSGLVLCVLITNLLLARRPLYALSEWITRRVPEHLGLQPDEIDRFNDDRIGRALDHLQRADRASLLIALVKYVVVAFQIDLSEFHQDTTSVTMQGDYRGQAAVDDPDRPPRITFGYNKDHRPDLKQLLYSVTISSDGAVPLHCKIYDGNTTDDKVHIDTWWFLRQLTGHSGFLYVADSKLCTRENMQFIASKGGRFLTIMPRTRAEDKWFREHVGCQVVDWQEVHREADSRGKKLPEVVYHGVESPGHIGFRGRAFQRRKPANEAETRRFCNQQSW